MGQFILKRCLALLVSLGLIAITGFILLQLTPGDPVRQMMGITSATYAGKQDSDHRTYESLYRKLALDKPPFYVTWCSAAVPDSFYFLPLPERRNQLIKLSAVTGHPAAAYAFRKSLEELQQSLQQSKEMNADSVLDFLTLTEKISHATNIGFLRSLVNAPEWKATSLPTSIAAKYVQVQSAFAAVLEAPAPWKHWIPVLGFTLQNRFHFWLFGNNSGSESTFRTAGILNGDFGNSYISHRAVKTELWQPFKLTVIISTATVFLSLLLSIPLGCMLVLYKNTWFGKTAPLVMNFVYAIPLFFMATLLLEIFANPDVLPWFPISGTGPIGGTPEGVSLWQELRIRFPYFILPVISYFYGATIFFSRMLQAQLEQELDLDYIRTARAKGASEFNIIFRHALKNSFFPILTVSLDALPLMFAGSILLESLFSLPGMAFTLLGAVQNQDHPVLIACFVLIGSTISVMYMVLDILYKVLDPRLQRSAKEVNHA